VSSADPSTSRGRRFGYQRELTTDRVCSLTEKLRILGQVDGVVVATVEQPLESFGDLLRVKVEPLARAFTNRCRSEHGLRSGARFRNPVPGGRLGTVSENDKHSMLIAQLLLEEFEFATIA